MHTTQEALDITIFDSAPPLKRTEVIEAMAKALYQKRFQEVEAKRKAFEAASTNLKQALIKQLHEFELSSLLEANSYWVDYDSHIRFNLEVRFNYALVSKEWAEVQKNPNPSPSFKYLNIDSIKGELRRALAVKGMSRVDELLKDTVISKKFEQMAEEVLTTSATIIDTK